MKNYKPNGGFYDAWFDSSKISIAVRDILESIGDDPDREGLRSTPDRVAELYRDLFSGMR